MPDQWPGSGEPTLFDDDQAAASVPLMTPEQADARRHELRGMSADERLQGILDVQQIREQLHQGFRAAYIPSRPCPRCGSTKAEIRQSGDHLPVSCLDCGGTFYNASKLEAGFKPRSVSNLRKGISVGKRARILDRDHGRCVLCADATNLMIGHLLSVADGEKVGATQDELYADENLAAMCETCNSGLSKRSVSLLTYVIMHHLLEVNRERARPQVALPPR